MHGQTARDADHLAGDKRGVFAGQKTYRPRQILGQADTTQRKVEICQRAYRLLVKEADFDPTDIIFGWVVPSS